MNGEDRVLTGWGRTSPSRASVERPFLDDEVADALRRGSPRGVLARGLGRSYGDVAQNAGGTVLDMTSFVGGASLDEVAGTVTAGAGESFDRLLHRLVPAGWFLPVVPGTRFVTLGGAIANDIHGKNHHVDGSLGRHLSSIDMILPNGERTMLTRDSDLRLWAATVGGLGLTGVIVRATVQLRQVESAFVRMRTERAQDLDDLMSRMSADDDRHPYSVAWLDCLARGRRLGRGVLSRGDHAKADELPARSVRDALAYRSRSLPAVPGGIPRLTTPATAKAFNELWFRRAPRQPRDDIVGIDAFFFPLDAVPSWNRVYGRRGFVQWQCVVPFGEERAIVDIVERISARGCPSFLAVLKRFGPGSGMLSFPISGWTLALDFPAGARGLAELLGEMDRRVVDAGGRIYLGKDSRLDPSLVPGMYPELESWSQVRASVDPRHVLRSDLERRIDLWKHAQAHTEVMVRA